MEDQPISLLCCTSGSGEITAPGDPLSEVVTRSSGHPRLRPSMSRRTTLNQSALVETCKRDQAKEFMNSNNFMQAWELYNEIGDRISAQDAMEQAYRSSKTGSKLWVTCAPAPADEGEYAEQHEARCVNERNILSAACSMKTSEIRQPSSAGFLSADTSTWFRPLSSASQASTAASNSERMGIAKVLRRVLGINQRKVSKVKDLYGQWVEDWGPMSKTEFSDGIKSVLESIDAAVIDTEFSLADADCDGFIVENEFVEWFLHT